MPDDVTTIAHRALRPGPFLIFFYPFLIFVFFPGTRLFFFLILTREQISAVNHFWKYSPFPGAYSFLFRIYYPIPCFHFCDNFCFLLSFFSLSFLLDLETWG
ncbi:unnamed protein product [Tuber melanosporum]|uniref:(Perigord truffle) hypothetical protein n=1 Tax=Tuber melanosporum (strain Mel28) TaxID=656061 RepID=D5GF16_TUBMM|nr:uncharacterized protein GSTUM_00006697001 [Tuber melanosporum]CAZ83109.1 unnamed protein product [Tuber melanosporum]